MNFLIRLRLRYPTFGCCRTHQYPSFARSAQTCCDRSSPLRECKELKEFREFREPRKPIAKLLKFPKLPVTLTTLIRQPPYLKEWLRICV